MNPFDLTGPNFLIFYGILGFTTIIILRLYNRFREEGNPRAGVNFSDPYEIAFLRSGRHEAVRVATVSLIDRGLLKATGSNLVAARPDAAHFAQRPIEQAILEEFRRSASAYNVTKDANSQKLDAACKQYKAGLQQLGFIPNAGVFMSRLVALLISLAIIGGVAAVKINVALSRGQHNIAFLVILLIVFTIAALVAFAKRRTRAGDIALKRLKEHYAQLKTRASRIKAGGTTNEAALFAAIWGLTDLPASQFPYVKTLYPKAASTTTDGSWSGGCGGSSGGGCGGCGGCGG